MTHPKYSVSFVWAPALTFVPGGWFGTGLTAQAQVVPDATLPAQSVVSTASTPGLQRVTGGTRLGKNLFHSFEQFSIPTGETVEFSNGLNVEIVFSRVTGGDRSILEGTLTSLGDADFFLLNPNGFVFGPNAQLNVGGSFVASSANAVEFSDGSRFSAVAPQATDLLSINTPVGLQYGAVPGEILVEGNGHGL
ncbi:MAG: filamentous hemagglutinin N-terminal domain-containing protein, partial [Phormidesmis sp.]